MIPVIASAASAFVLAAVWRILAFAGFQNDHYVHLARAQQVILGDLPIRDFVDPGMPAMYLVSAAVWAIAGGSPATELLLVAFAFGLAAACTVIVVHRVTGSLMVALAAAVLEVLMFPRTYSYPKVMLYAAAACAIVAVSARPSRGRVLLAGALTALAFLFRHDHGVYVGIAVAVSIVLATMNLGWRVVGGRLAWFATVTGLLIAPWLGFVAYHEGLGAYVRSGLEFSRAESERNRGPLTLPALHISELVSLTSPYRPVARLQWKPDTSATARRQVEAQYGLEPVATGESLSQQYYGPHLTTEQVRALADDPNVEDVQGLDRLVEWSDQDALRARLSPSRLHVLSEDNAYAWLFYVFYLLPLACAAAAWWRARADGLRSESIAVGSLAVMAALANVGLLRGNLSVWLPDAIAPAVILGAWMVPFAWRAPLTRRGVRVVTRTIITLATATTFMAVVRAGDLASQIEHSRAGAGIQGISERLADLHAHLWGRHREVGSTPSGVSDALLPFFDYVTRCTEQSDRLLMAQLYPDVFVLAERGFAGGHVAFLEGFYSSPADQALTLSRLQRESVAFVLLPASHEDEFRHNFDLLSAHLDSRYRILASIPLEGTDAVRVFVDAGRTPRRTDSATGWPCFR